MEQRLQIGGSQGQCMLRNAAFLGHDSAFMILLSSKVSRPYPLRVPIPSDALRERIEIAWTGLPP